MTALSSHDEDEKTFVSYLQAEMTKSEKESKE